MSTLTARLAALGIEVPELGEYAAAAGPTTGSYVDRRWADAALAALVTVVERLEADARVDARIVSDRQKEEDQRKGYPVTFDNLSEEYERYRARVVTQLQQAEAEVERLKRDYVLLPKPDPNENSDTTYLDGVDWKQRAEQAEAEIAQLHDHIFQQRYVEEHAEVERLKWMLDEAIKHHMEHHTDAATGHLWSVASYERRYEEAHR